jgi:hypothetical protein
MHAVHDAITIRAQVIGTLEYPGKNVHHFFSELVHRKRLVSSVAVQEKCLEKQRQVPMSNKKNENLLHKTGSLGVKSWPKRGQLGVRPTSSCFVTGFDKIIFAAGERWKCLLSNAE